MSTPATKGRALDPSISITIEAERADETREVVLKGLRRFNRKHAGPPEFRLVTLAARDATGRLVGGLAGEIGWKWLHVSLLWVDEARRGKGIGRALLRAAEKEAARQGCGHVYLDTLEFQARPFYEGEGYRPFGVLEGYPPGHRQYYLSKALAENGGAGSTSSPGRSTICWKRLDVPGHEAAELHRRGEGWRLHGVVVMSSDDQASSFEYTIDCDASWQSLRAIITTRLGSSPGSLMLERTTAGEWRANGTRRPDLRECVDVDLSFTPSTNLLPIRRLALAVGDSASVRAAWVRLPDLGIEVLEQVYRRTGEWSYRYESANGTFQRDLVVNERGLVVDYPGLWVAEEPPAS